MDTINQKKYIEIPNFFTKEELDFLKVYTKKQIMEVGFKTDPQSPHAASFCSDLVMESFLETKLPLCEEASGLKLFKTYCYWRGYVFGSTLDTHTDRPACEISISASIENDGDPWPIHMNNNWFNIKEGDAVMYLGNEVPHGREPYDGIYNSQVFFHYVDQAGGFKDHKDDQIDRAKHAGILKK